MQRFFVAVASFLVLCGQTHAQQRITVTTLDGQPIVDGARAYNDSTISGTCDYDYNPMMLHAYRIHLAAKGTSPGNPNNWVICQPDGTWSVSGLNFFTPVGDPPKDAYYTFHAFPCPSTMSCDAAETWDLKARIDPFTASGSIGGNSGNRTLDITLRTASAADRSQQEGYLAAMIGDQIFWVERSEQVVGDDLCKTPGTYNLRDTKYNQQVGCYKYNVKPYASATSYGRILGCEGSTTCSASASFNLGPMEPMGVTFVVGTGANLDDLLTNRRYKLVTTY